MELMPVTSEALNLIKNWSPNGVCEIGAMKGVWVDALRQNGVETIGYDVSPNKGDNVVLGDHSLAAAFSHSKMTLLVIWPPDGPAVQEWISAWRGDVVILGIKQSRVELGTCLDGFSVAEQITVPGGRKGVTNLSVNVRTGKCH